MSALVVGDPMEDGTDVGPLATEQGREDVEALVKDAVDKGATVLRRRRAPGPATAGGTRRRWSRTSPRTWTCTSRRSSGRWPRCTAPTDIEDAVRIANATRFGLGSNAWTNDAAEEQEVFIRDLAAGQTFINGMVAVVPGAALRRRQGLRPRPRAGRARHPRVHQHQDGLGRQVARRRPHGRVGRSVTPVDQPADVRRLPGVLDRVVEHAQQPDGQRHRRVPPLVDDPRRSRRRTASRR